MASKVATGARENYTTQRALATQHRSRDQLAHDLRRTTDNSICFNKNSPPRGRSGGLAVGVRVDSLQAKAQDSSGNPSRRFSTPCQGDAFASCPSLLRVGTLASPALPALNEKSIKTPPYANTINVKTPACVCHRNSSGCRAWEIAEVWRRSDQSVWAYALGTLFSRFFPFMKTRPHVEETHPSPELASATTPVTLT